MCGKEGKAQIKSFDREKVCRPPTGNDKNRHFKMAEKNVLERRQNHVLFFIEIYNSLFSDDKTKYKKKFVELFLLYEL